jgi:ligand-binding SRPBCC domain-containing protein
MRVHVLAATQWVPTDLDTTFAFFADAANLEALTPPLLRFRIRTPLPIAMRAGALIEYDLALHGVPVRWRTRIDEWTPGVAFVDTQLAGPYARWVHRHTFARVAGGTLLGDRVEYALPLDPLSRPVHALYVRPTIERIFAFRRAEIARRFGGEGREAPPG